MNESSPDFLGLTRDLCEFRTGVVAEENELLFKRISQEIPLRIHRYPSDMEHLGWRVPKRWNVKRALIKKNGTTVFDGTTHTLGVAYYSKSFIGALDFSELKPHLVTNSRLPDAFMFHCQWQYRPWDADWAFCVPYRIYKELTPGRFQVELETKYEPGEMLVADSIHRGQRPDTIVFHSNSCHPHMANDGFAGTSVMIRLFQWLAKQTTSYTYRLVIGPEHVGTVFYLAEMDKSELALFSGGVFGEMMGTSGPVKLAASFPGNTIIDRAFRIILRHYVNEYKLVPWRQSVGNDETVWEAPGYEVPFVQINRAQDDYPFPEYHSSLDNPELMDSPQLQEFYEIFKHVIFVLENNSRMFRKFDGIVCLSNPKYQLYHERQDPAVDKILPKDAEKWGYLNDCILRYFDGQHTILDVAEKHDLPFDRLFFYLKKFEEKGLISMRFDPINQRSISSSS